MNTNTVSNALEMKKVVLVVISLVLAWQLMATSAFAQSSEIYGYVFAGEDQATPLAGSDVELLAEDGTQLDTTSTNDNGQYTFAVDAGSYLIRNSVNGDVLPTTLRDDMVMVGMDFYNTGEELVAVALSAPDQLATVTGYVFGSDDTTSRVEGAVVGLFTENFDKLSTTSTSADGSYTFEVASGTYLLQNSVTNDILSVTVDAGRVMVGMDFYDSELETSALSVTNDVPLAVSLNNVGTSVSSLNIAIVAITVALAIATMPKLSKEA